ncbi:MAG: DUF3106 domain-containing protein [Planctomycetota bacterium]|nr:DUF3106 domain-containing protein [Planctomycetota bacterium]
MRTVRAFLALSLALICVSLLAVGSSAQDRRLEEARARWEQLSPDEQARLRERFEHLRTMPAKDRASLEDRARALAEAVSRVEQRLTPEQRARLDNLDPKIRRALLRDLAMIEGGDRGARGHGPMADAMREKLERMPPEERAQAMADMQQKMRERGREKVAELLARKFGLSAAEIARLEALPEAERMLEIAKLKRAAEGPDAARREEGMAARMKLLLAARPRAADHLRYADLPTAERRELVEKIVRERVMSALRESGFATPAEIEALEQMTLDQFRQAMRERFTRERGRKSERPDDARRR